MTVGAALAKQRIESKKRLIDLSRATGYSVAFISDVMRDRTNPSLRMFVRLCHSMNVKPGMVLEDVDRWVVRDKRQNDKLAAHAHGGAVADLVPEAGKEGVGS